MLLIPSLHALQLSLGQLPVINRMLGRNSLQNVEVKHYTAN